MCARIFVQGNGHNAHNEEKEENGDDDEDPELAQIRGPLPPTQGYWASCVRVLDPKSGSETI
jgi:hypothetical protein